MIHGRAAEQAALDQLLADAAAGRSGALVIRGEEGVGKSTLLGYAGDRAAARGVPVLRGVGIETEAEAELPYATLHHLLHGHRDRLDALPAPQAAALRAAFGMAEVPTGDRFLAGVGVLTLLSDLAGDGALLVLVDDAQWIDQSSAGALLFAARRLDAEGVVMIFAGQDSDEPFRTPGLPELPVTGLDPAAATTLLAEHHPQLAPDVRELRNRRWPWSSCARTGPPCAGRSSPDSSTWCSSSSSWPDWPPGSRPGRPPPRPPPSGSG